MTAVSDGNQSAMVYPKTLLSIAVSIGSLAVFLIIASAYLISSWLGSTDGGYLYGVNHSRGLDFVSAVDAGYVSARHQGDASGGGGWDRNATVGQFEYSDGGFGDSMKSILAPSTSPGNKSVAALIEGDEKGVLVGRDQNQSANSRLQETAKSTPAPPGIGSDSESRRKMDQEMLFHERQHQKKGMNSSLKYDAIPSTPGSPLDSGCDIFHGKWVYDSRGPLYRNDSCPVLTQTQNCQGNGRPDKEYENWRWKPTHCDLPRFHVRNFLELMRGKTLAFVGDSIARNQMESMLCILWQVEVPKYRGNRRIHRYYFASTSTTIARIWSAWLVHQTSGGIDFAPAGLDKLHLDTPDERFMEFIPQFDVVVISSGHWFTKNSAYIFNNEVVGWQLWRPNKSRKMKVNNVKAFGISVETILSAMVTHPNYTGLTIVRTFSPDHYEGGLWDTGGSCTGKVQPIKNGELVENEWTAEMYKQQIGGFSRAIKKMRNKSRLKLMDVTEAFGYRHDGHPGPYRSIDPNKKTNRGPDGRPPTQDCLHWCMPGPVDTWNEMLFEVIRREFNVKQNDV